MIGGRREASGELDLLRDTLGKLQSERDQYLKERDRYLQEREQYRALYLKMMETCALLERGILAQKSERLRESSEQLSLQVLGAALGVQATATAAGGGDGGSVPVAEHERQKPTGRRPLPEGLPRVTIEMAPPEVQRAGLDNYEKIGEEVRETVERRRASWVVARLVYPKYVLKQRDKSEPTRVLAAEPAELPIERGMAGPGLLADTVVKRWQDHIPLHRMEGIYEREGLHLARSTLCGFHQQLGELVLPVTDAMFADALLQHYLCVDATGVLVQAKDRCRVGHFWGGGAGVTRAIPLQRKSQWRGGGQTACRLPWVSGGGCARGLRPFVQGRKGNGCGVLEPHAALLFQGAGQRRGTSAAGFGVHQGAIHDRAKDGE